MKKIAVLIGSTRQDKVIGDKYFDMLSKLGPVYKYDQPNFADKEHALEFLAGADAIVTSWGSPKLTAEFLDVCPDLKVVLHAAGSVKGIVDEEEFKARGIRLTSSAIALGEGVAETALCLSIAAAKGVFKLAKDTRNGLWAEHKYDYCTDFYDITVGVISGGFVGRHFIKLLQNFNVDVLLYDPTLSAEQVAALGATKAELDEMLSKADVISVHAPSIPATEKMLNATNLPLIKDGAVLINTSRGAVFDEPALIEELKKGRFFACLDVTEPEPPTVDNELRYLDNVVLTPHIAGAATNGQRRIGKHVAEELARFMAGERMRTEIDLSQLSKMA